MRQIDLLQLSEEEKKMTATEFLKYLELKRKESTADFVKNIEGKDAIFRIGEAYYVFMSSLLIWNQRHHQFVQTPSCLVSIEFQH